MVLPFAWSPGGLNDGEREKKEREREREMETLDIRVIAVNFPSLVCGSQTKAELDVAAICSGCPT